MSTIFCSNKLEKLIGSVGNDLTTDVDNKLGNWNGHLFIAERKKILLFTNDKTAYSFVMTNIKKADMKDFENLFRESLIKQLDHDISISERQEVMVRTCLSDIRLAKTNNNKKILGTMNDFIGLIKFEIYRHGGLSNLTNISIGYGLNNHFVGARLERATEKYSVPKELMEGLLVELS